MSGQRLLDQTQTFATLCKKLNIDPRIRKAIARLGFVRPTLVQSQSLPLSIESGKDLLVRARTGSGKTLSYLIPILYKILREKSKESDESNEDNTHEDFVKAVILVPTRELSQQVYDMIQKLCFYCEDVVSFTVLSNNTNSRNSTSEKEMLATQEAMLRDRPDIVISTPAGLLNNIKRKVLHLKNSVETIVVDEADLVLSFGYSQDIAEIVKELPSICQGILCSATLTPELDDLKRVVLHSPAVLKLEEDTSSNGDSGGSDEDGTLKQFYLRLPNKDKQLVIYVFLKLGLLKGKGLFFVNSTDAGYRLKLFLEQFHIRSAVLNAELPVRSRMSIIDQFNAGNFDYLIATDESASSSNHHTTQIPEEQKEEKGKKKKRHRNKKDSEYGTARGLDFRNVSFVFNVDIPKTSDSYTHRIGRTARGGQSGVALTLVSKESDEDNQILEMIQSNQPRLPVLGLGAGVDGKDELKGEQEESENNTTPQPTPLEFDLKEIEGFRYRVEDVSRAVTRVAIRETRAAELKAEILNSERLAGHFDANPNDLQLLRHDRTATHVSRVQDHLK